MHPITKITVIKSKQRRDILDMVHASVSMHFLNFANKIATYKEIIVSIITKQSMGSTQTRNVHKNMAHHFL
jgi:hypothetical protein